MIKKYLFNLSFLILLLLPILALFHPGFPITHDGQDHVARIANFYQNLTEGNLIPRWAGNLNWGYGHPILEFLYPFPSYIASFIHFIGFSLMSSTKIVFMLGMILSLPFMYLWLSRFSSKYAALLGAVLYTYAPYRFVDLYVRGDIGESMAFAFVPLSLYFIYQLFKTEENKYLTFGSISIALLITSHNAISLMLLPFIFIYSFILFFYSKKRKVYLTKIIILILFGFGMAAFFWIPALLEGKYTLRNIVTKGGYLIHFVKLSSLFYGPWSYGTSGQFTVQLGIGQWLGLILSPLTLFMVRKNKQNFYLVLSLIAFTLSAIFLMLPVSNFVWEKVLLLQNFQFPWRFLGITVLTCSVLVTLLVDLLSHKINVKITSIILIVFVLVVSIPYMQPKGYQYKPESFYARIFPGTTDTGESAPIWSVRFMEGYPKNHLDVVDGKASIKELKRTTTDHKYQVDVEKRTLFKENTLFFPGWSINASGKQLSFEFQNMQYRGVMLFFLDKGSYMVEAKYAETKLRLISDILSLLSLVCVLILLSYKFVKKRIN